MTWIHRNHVPHRRGRARALAPLALLVASASVLAGCLTPDDPAADRIWMGAYVPYQQGYTTYNSVVGWESTYSGRKLDAVRLYYRWDSGFPASDEVKLRDRGTRIVANLETRRKNGTVIKWADIAAAQPGSALYNEVVAWVRKFKAFGAAVTVTFNAEFEETGNYGAGETDVQYRAAFNRVGAIIDAEGASNVKLAWVPSAWSFYETGAKQASRWYPGDKYVDVIGADGFNWSNCRRSTETWRSFTTIFSGLRDFGAAHPKKPLLIGEVGSVEDPAVVARKADWIKNMVDTLQTPAWSQFTTVLWFNSIDGSSAACDWRIQSSSRSVNSWKAVLARPYTNA